MNWQETRTKLISLGISERSLPEQWQVRINLSDADLIRADLRGADLSGAVLRRAVLRDADLSGAVLSGADLRDAVISRPGFSPIPESELAKRILAHVADDSESLEMSSWHICDTVHCGWGWAVVENGDAGRALEYALGIEAAGAILFPSFAPFVTASNEKAIQELKRIAEEK